MRFDKRGIGKSASNTGDPSTLSIDDYVADVAAAVAALAPDTRFSKIILLGHSEGAGHVRQAANRGASVAGVILAAPQGRRLAEILHEQFARQADSAASRGSIPRSRALYAAKIREKHRRSPAL